jgi:hypothetical protein
MGKPYNFDNMKILELKDISRKETHIYYRRIFNGTVVMELMHKPVEKRIEFIIETTPMGKKNISVSLIDHIEYPLMPLINGLRTKIAELDAEGVLP